MQGDDASTAEHRVETHFLDFYQKDIIFLLPLQHDTHITLVVEIRRAEDVEHRDRDELAARVEARFPRVGYQQHTDVHLSSKLHDRDQDTADLLRVCHPAVAAQVDIVKRIQQQELYSVGEDLLAGGMEERADAGVALGTDVED